MTGYSRSGLVGLLAAALIYSTSHFTTAQPALTPSPANAGAVANTAGSALCPPFKMTVIYNAFLSPIHDWRLILLGQVADMRDLAQCAGIHVVLITHATLENHTRSQLEDVLMEAEFRVRAMLPARKGNGRTGVTIRVLHDNAFEYHGIYLTWLLAQEVDEGDAANSLFFYAHTKGMTNWGELTTRLPAEREQMRELAVYWRNVTRVFAENATVDRVGLFPAPEGWVWINFWWARATHLKKLVEPVRYTGRMYYENYLGRIDDGVSMKDGRPGALQGCDTCHSLCGPGRTYYITFQPGPDGAYFPLRCDMTACQPPDDQIYPCVYQEWHRPNRTQLR